jgi:5-methylcytosine-specific restriction endonuclease McrA
MSPVRMCAHPKCGACVLKGYCAEHASMGRSTNKAWYDTKRWKLARNRQLFDTPLCERCGRVAEHVHHDPPLTRLLAEGRSGYDPQVIVSLCRSCHSTHHKTTAPGGRSAA